MVGAAAGVSRPKLGVAAPALLRAVSVAEKGLPALIGPAVMALKDGRGSVVGYYQAEATPQGLLATADYTPEGRVTSRDWVTGTTCTETGSTQCPRLGGLPFGFHGAYKSPAHGLLYFRNRWYSAEAGQWLTQIPV